MFIVMHVLGVLYFSFGLLDHATALYSRHREQQKVFIVGVPTDAEDSINGSVIQSLEQPKPDQG